MPTVMQWVQHLETKIEEQKRYALPWECRYDNEYALPFIANEYREVYGTKADNLVHKHLEAPRTGTAAISVDAITERLTVLGYTSDDTETARQMQVAWEDNALDVMHREAHRDALVRRNAFGAVSRSVDGNRGILTIESSEQAAVHRMAAPPYDVDAYMKRWVDEWTGQWHGLLQLPGWDYDLVRGENQTPDPEGSTIASAWSVKGEPRPRPGAVPVVEFEHKSRLLKPAQSEIESIYTLVDMCDLIDGLMVFAGHFGAVPIRWGTGIDIPRDPSNPALPLRGPDGEVMMGFKPRADHFWFTSNADGKFGQMVPATLDTYVTWANWARAELRANTKVASTYYALDLKSHMSAELLKVDEAPMVRRVKSIGQQGTFNHAWRRCGQLLAEVEGLKGRVKPLWEDPQTRMEAAAVDAFQKAVASGIGVVHAAQEFLGWSKDLAEAAVAEAQAAGIDPELERISRQFFDASQLSA